MAVAFKQRCYRCKKPKLLREFCNDRTRPNGKGSRCNQCNREKAAAFAKTPIGRMRHRIYQLRRAYGITIEQYHAMQRAQDGKCAICKRPPTETQRKQFYVDHDHETGTFRGLLCGGCNSAIGLVRESIETLRSAIAYLEKHQN